MFNRHPLGCPVPAEEERRLKRQFAVLYLKILRAPMR